MRLYDTLTRDEARAPAAAGADPHVLLRPDRLRARPHRQRAAVRDLGMWLRRWLRERGYDVTLVHNITDINDKIYDAAPGRSAELAERGDRLVPRGHGRPRARAAGREPRATEYVPEIVRSIEELVEREFAYAVDGDVYFRVARFPDYGQLSRPAPGRDGGGGAERAQGESARLRALEGDKEGEDTSWDSPWGRGRPGWHIECSVMAEEHLGPVFEIHGGGLDLVFPHHENEIAQSRALGHDVRADLDAQRDARSSSARRCRSRSATSSRFARRIDEWGRETLLALLPDRPLAKPIDFTDDDARRRRPPRRRRFRNVFRGPSAPSPTVRGSAFAACSRRRLQHAGCAGGSPRLARPRAPEPRARRLRARLARGRVDGARGRRRARRGARAGARGQGLRRIGPAARRDRRAPAGRSATPPPASSSSLAMTPDLVYGRRAVREALRGPPAVLELYASERALAAEPWLADERAPRAGRARARADASVAGTPDHQGVVAVCEPYRYADAYELAAKPDPLLVCLDSVTDPRNLGAVCRSAEGAGATGVVAPRSRVAGVTPAVCRASAGAVEHLPVAVVPNLARYLDRGEGPGALGLRRRGEAATPMWEADLTGGVALVLGAEGKGIRPLVRRDVRRASCRSRWPGTSSRSTSASPRLSLLYEAAAGSVAAVPDPTLYLFDGYNLLHAGAFADARELVDLLASFVAHAGARGVVVFDGAAKSRDRPALSPLRPPRRHAARAARRRAPRKRDRLPRFVRRRASRHVRATRCASSPRPAFLGDLEPARTRGAGRVTRRASALDDETRARSSVCAAAKTSVLACCK